ncbi:Gfo/Idh/MocA family oxidoreductase [Flavobacteriaceae bacterium]|nr:Gfo/Idh/MocA family oxidoreductase [Flavobacteriaceae bacterium]
MKKFKFIIVGCGRIGNRHAQHISNLGELVAVCDNIKSKADRISEKYKTQKFYNIDDLLNSNIDFDVAAICTPNGLHAEHSIKFLNKKVNVLCEKPLALNTKDCGDMIMAAEKNNVRLFAVKQNRFNPPIVKLKELLQENKLGKINSIQLNCFWNRNFDYYNNSWKGTMDLDGGTLFTQFSHFIDLLYYFCGDVSDVKGFSNNFQHDTIEFEDAGVVALKFLSGTIGTINYNVNCFNKNFEGSLTIFGSKGTLKIGGQYLNELEYQEIENMDTITVDKGNAPNNYGKYFGSMSNHSLVYENLIDVLNNNSSINANAYEAMKTVEIIEKIYKEIRK